MVPERAKISWCPARRSRSAPRSTATACRWRFCSPRSRRSATESRPSRLSTSRRARPVGRSTERSSPSRAARSSGRCMSSEPSRFRRARDGGGARVAWPRRRLGAPGGGDRVGARAGAAQVEPLRVSPQRARRSRSTRSSASSRRAAASSSTGGRMASSGMRSTWACCSESLGTNHFNLYSERLADSEKEAHDRDR